MTRTELEAAVRVEVNLYYAKLQGADLYGADLRGANLRGANLRGASLPENWQICPRGKTFKGYKKVKGGTILELEILGPATNSLVGRKCRTAKARVVRAIGTPEIHFRSMRDPSFKYTVGEVVEVAADLDIRVECTSGIHFFMTEQEARDY